VTGTPREGVAPADPVRKALDIMSSRNLGALLVVENGKVVGIFSERDALRKGLYREGTDRPVRELMTPDPDCLTPEDPIAFAMNRMGVGGYRHVPLVDDHRRPVGMLVMRDVVRYILQFFPAEALNVPPHSEHAPPNHDLEGG
jgi:CBS domain-containing protein